MRGNARTIAYAVVIGVILLAVALLLAKMARTELANRRLITIAGVILLMLLVGGVGVMGFRSRSRHKSKPEEDDAPKTR